MPLKNPLPKSFYERDPAIVAKALLGQTMIRRIGRKVLTGKIIETEAYYGAKDPASRAFDGKVTKLSRWMWREPGTIFVYMVHGNWLFNIITGKTGEPSGVLIRGVEPLEGLETMIKNRGIYDIEKLTSGPGKLTKAFNITNNDTGLNVSNKNSSIIVVEGNRKIFEISSSHRIGVKKDLPEKLRFYIRGNSFVSKKKVVKL